MFAVLESPEKRTRDVATHVSQDVVEIVQVFHVKTQSEIDMTDCPVPLIS